MKAVLQYRASPGFRKQVAAFDSDWLTTVTVDETDTETFGREMLDADVLLHILEPVTAAVIESSPRLKLIQKVGVGVNTIDLETARRKNVAVCNMPGTNTQAVAEMTLLLMLATLRRVAELDSLTRRGEGWNVDPTALDDTGELSGRTVGLVGCGAVARRLIPMLAAIGARVAYTSRREIPEVGARFLPFRDLLATADVLSLHLPLTPETQSMMNAAAFAAMKPRAVLVNTARGGLVDEAALLGALTEGTLLGAGLDVFGQEPVANGNPLLKLPNVVVTPHLAWFTPETLGRSLGVFAENCRRVRDGEPLLNRVV